MAYTKIDQIYDALREHGPMTTDRIAEVTGFKKGTVSTSLNYMHSGGEVRGEPDHFNRRRYVWHVTSRPSRYGTAENFRLQEAARRAAEAVTASNARAATHNHWLRLSYRPRAHSRRLGLRRRCRPMATERPAGFVARLLGLLNTRLEVD